MAGPEVAPRAGPGGDGPGTQTIPAPSLAPERTVDPDRGWKVVLFNDEVTPFDVVVFALQRAAGLSLEVAEMVAYEAHSQEEAVVRSGLTQDDAEAICTALRAWTRIEGICPGVECDAIEDD